MPRHFLSFCLIQTILTPRDHLYNTECPENPSILQFQLGYPDSNQKKQDQNLLCYHYTIAQ